MPLCRTYPRSGSKEWPRPASSPSWTSIAGEHLGASRIRQLAEELNTPEHQLRALINQRLGYKNFSTFLNGYRIEETCERLTDPKEARIPILTIALDAGFASLTPFNRAFRQATGMTPSEYRRDKLKPSEIVTPIRR